jgi:cobalamin biosynthesis Mg chelatase CobN
MNGMRRRQPLLSGPAFAAMSVIALLALACLPSLALAGDSSEIEYQNAVPNPYGENNPTHHQHHHSPPVAHSSETGGTAPGGSGSGSSRGGSSGGGSTSSNGGGSPARTGNGGGTGQGSPGSGAGGKESPSVQGGNHAGEAPASQSGEGGGSSPLVPILIAIAVLAAISVGAVMYRQRRQRDVGSSRSVSPEAH